MNNKKAIVSRHNPVLTALSADSPLSVGNGEFCFTADITGMQTLYDTYDANHFPLCTMSNWGWHTAPTDDGKIYKWSDLQLTEYEHAGRKVHYPTEAKPGNEDVYHWLRHNPHKFNLGRISLCRENGKKIIPDDIKEAHQELYIYEGTLHSRFTLDDETVEVTTICDAETDTIAFKIKTNLEGLGVKIDFPYGSHETSGSDWKSPGKHETEFYGPSAMRKMDDVNYIVNINLSEDDGKFIYDDAGHGCTIFPLSAFEMPEVWYTFHFVRTGHEDESFSLDLEEEQHFPTIQKNNTAAWKNFWSQTKLADFSKITDPRAKEIERRMVLSLYLFKIQAMSSLPPAETGLTVNSWYGRFHSEMFLWNSAFLPLWNLGDKLMPGIKWYQGILPQAKALAASNGYKGIRLPKQTADTGRDAPSIIAPLLVWQQPHIIYMLELLYQNTYKTDTFLQEYWHLVKSLAEFLASFLHQNETTGQYEMLPPLIPAQEVFDPRQVKSPLFEMEYFRHGLNLACAWGCRLNEDTQNWAHIAENIADPVIENGLYLANANCPDTFEKYNRDHPMMTGAFGLFKSPKIDAATMKATLQKVLDCWEQETMWGWDYAMMAMCAINTGDSALAIELLLSDNPKNQYVQSGNNYQRTRTDLPLYLPGNGSLLLALPMLFENPPQGWEISTE